MMVKETMDDNDDPQDSTFFDFNIRVICFLGLTLGLFILALMCVCKTYECFVKSETQGLSQDSREPLEEERAPLIIMNSTALEESSTNYHTAIQDSSSNSSSSDLTESIVVI